MEPVLVTIAYLWPQVSAVEALILGLPVCLAVAVAFRRSQVLEADRRPDGLESEARESIRGSSSLAAMPLLGRPSG